MGLESKQRRGDWITILHGYHLDDSGSCLYVQNLAREFARMGKNVLLICQEPEADTQDYIAACYDFRDDGGSLFPVFERETRYAGKVVCFRPFLRAGLLPVYVEGPFRGFDNIKPFSRLTQEEIDSYLDANVQALLQVARLYPVEAIYAQHVLMMPYVALLAQQQNPRLRYHLLPHGSELEYLIRDHPRFHRLALKALEGAETIIVGSREMMERLESLFPELSARLRSRFRLITIGVDTDYFSEPLHLPVEARVAKLQEEIQRQIKESAGATVSVVAKDFSERLGSVDFEKEKILVNFGKLIPGKGVQDLIAIAPVLFERYPDLRIFIAGDGPSKETLQELIRALQAGKGESFFAAIEPDAAENRAGTQDLYQYVQAYFADLGSEGTEEYFRRAASHNWSDRIIFSGYLKHAALRYLLCLSQVSVFPSIVKEAYPLALLEAMATGSFPIVSDWGGLRDGLLQVSEIFEDQILDGMKIPMEAASRLRRMAERIGLALGQFDPEMKKKQVAHIRANCDWSTVCRSLLKVFEA